MSRADVLRGARAPKRAAAPLPAGRILEPYPSNGSFRWRIDPYPGVDPAFPLGAKGSPGPKRTWRGVEAKRLLARELEEVEPGHRIALGARTDPWPYGEGGHGRTRTVLEALARREGFEVSITTRSDRVAIELDRLVELADRHRLEVNVVLATLDRGLAAALEPGAQRPDLRLKATSELAAAGVPVGALVSPVLPWVTDHPDALDALAAAIAGAGAGWIRALSRVMLPGDMVATFPALERTRPDAVDRVRDAHARVAASPERYAAGLDDLVERLRRRHGLREGDLRGGPADRVDGPQLRLL